MRRAAHLDADNPGVVVFEQADRAPRGPVNVQIDFDGIQQRILVVPGIAERPYSQLRAGVAGTVFYLEAASGGSALQRYRLSDRRAAPFVAGVSDYNVSADGRKLMKGAF